MREPLTDCKCVGTLGTLAFPDKLTDCKRARTLGTLAFSAHLTHLVNGSSGVQVGQVCCKWAAMGPAQVGQVCCKWVKWAASGNPIVPPEKSPSNCLLCEGDSIFKPSTASCLLAIRLTRVTHFGQHFLACRLPPHAKSPSNLIHFEGDFGEVDSGLYSTFPT